MAASREGRTAVRTLTEPAGQEVSAISQTTSGGFTRCGVPSGRAGTSQCPLTRTSRARTGNRVSSFVRSRPDPKLKLRTAAAATATSASRPESFRGALSGPLERVSPHFRYGPISGPPRAAERATPSRRPVLVVGLVAGDTARRESPDAEE